LSLLAPTAATVGPGGCQPYTASMSITGLPERVTGMACREADGRWHVVSEMPQ
jgi:surface antigen